LKDSSVTLNINLKPLMKTILQKKQKFNTV